MAIHPGLNSRYTVDQKKGEKTMAYLKGYVDHIRFRNEDNGYTVLSLEMCIRDRWGTIWLMWSLRT